MRALFTAYIAMMACGACAQKKEASFTSPANYHLDRPERIELPAELKEVSGITFLNGDPNTLFAQQDEDGHLYYLRPGDKSANYIKFAEQGDYEDLTINNKHFVLLRSDGSFFSFPLQQPDRADTRAVMSEKILPKGEYESLATSTADNRLYVLCKQCNVDKKTSQTTGYVIKLEANGKLTRTESFVIDNKEISKHTKLKGKAFRPSALAKNEKTNEWYILSSINKLLVIADNNWKVKEAHLLDPKLFNQPEGMAFDKDNNLYISNEAGDTEKATLLKFVYQKQ
ncbi:SdiA-regulated domain-containing protein [Olivibacter sp. XZL3]|uniref:SdiA-regulated domain-containing protein n=1 Tax=Olivibacter sp. XZL3 TaxID=1735116 RepID=UPI00106510D7|nr:SdiA-regulated domain-containing protein [Olivibacter sp. XZL3]